MASNPFEGLSDKSTENVFNMGLESLKSLRSNMNEYYFWFKRDDPISARGCLEAMYAEAYPDLDKNERNNCNKELAEIAKLVNQFKSEQQSFSNNKKQFKRADEGGFILAKGQLMNKLRNFYITKLIVYIDRHDLLRPKKDDPRFAALG